MRGSGSTGRIPTPPPSSRPPSITVPGCGAVAARPRSGWVWVTFPPGSSGSTAAPGPARPRRTHPSSSTCGRCRAWAWWARPPPPRSAREPRGAALHDHVARRAHGVGRLVGPRVGLGATSAARGGATRRGITPRVDGSGRRRGGRRHPRAGTRHGHAGPARPRGRGAGPDGGVEPRRSPVGVRRGGRRGGRCARARGPHHHPAVRARPGRPVVERPALPGPGPAALLRAGRRRPDAVPPGPRRRARRGGGHRRLGGRAVARGPERLGSRRGGPDPTPRAVVGGTAEGPFVIDLVRDGPHVLVGGTTGSGKSEFLRTLVTSLALSSPPDELAFVLVDFKGGAAFGPCTALPHVVGLVTDLDDHLVARALASLRAELRRRERLFAEVGAGDLEGYQRRRRPDSEAIPRLVVVVDELRALVEELPDFVSGLVRLAALGRSLGVHLVLATQRPSGAVSAEIQANVSLRIAFRMRDRSDSLDVLDDDAAAVISPGTPGRALARGGDGVLVSFQAATTSAPPAGSTAAIRVRPASSGEESLDRSPVGDGETTRLVDAVRGAHRLTGGRRPAAPWLAPLPDVVPPDRIAAGSRTAQGVPVAGLVDEPDLQRVSPLTLAGGRRLLAAVGPLGQRAHDGPARGGARCGRGPRVPQRCTCTSSTREVRLPTWQTFRTSAPALARTTHAPAPRSSGTCAPRSTVASTRLPPPPAWVRRRRRRAPPPVHRSPWSSSTGGTTSSRPSPPTLPTSCPVSCCGCCATGGRWAWSASCPAGGACSTHGGARSQPAPSSSARSTHWMPRWPACGPRTCLVTRRPGERCGCMTGARCSSSRRGPPTRRCSRPAPDVGRRSAAPGDCSPCRQRSDGTTSSTRVSVSRVDAGAGDISRPGAILVGVGGPTGAPWHWRPADDGRRLLVAGPPGSGRTNVLRVLAESLCAAGRFVAVVQPGSSPSGTQSWPEGVLMTGAEHPDPLIRVRRDHPDLVLLVDDADRLGDAPAVAGAPRDRRARRPRRRPRGRGDVLHGRGDPLPWPRRRAGPAPCRSPAEPGRERSRGPGGGGPRRHPPAARARPVRQPGGDHRGPGAARRGLSGARRSRAAPRCRAPWPRRPRGW